MEQIVPIKKQIPAAIFAIYQNMNDQTVVYEAELNPDNSLKGISVYNCNTKNVSDRTPLTQNLMEGVFGVSIRNQNNKKFLVLNGFKEQNNMMMIKVSKSGGVRAYKVIDKKLCVVDYIYIKMRGLSIQCATMHCHDKHGNSMTRDIHVSQDVIDCFLE